MLVLSCTNFDVCCVFFLGVRWSLLKWDSHIEYLIEGNESLFKNLSWRWQAHHNQSINVCTCHHNEPPMKSISSRQQQQKKTDVIEKYFQWTWTRKLCGACVFHRVRHTINAIEKILCHIVEHIRDAFDTNSTQEKNYYNIHSVGATENVFWLRKLSELAYWKWWQ